MKKFFRRALTVLLIVVGLLTATFVYAAVQIFDGRGEWHTNDDDNQQIAMSRAQQRAQLDAQKQAGLAIKTFSRNINSELTDDEVTAVTANIIEIVGDVHFDKKIIQLSDNQTTILYTATLKAKIDPEGIYDYLKRDDRDKVTIVQQNNELRDAIQKNDELAASLTEQYNHATTQAEKDKLRAQLNDADRYFLANQKGEQGNRLAYDKNYPAALKLYTEALQLNPNLAAAYNNRGNIYAYLRQPDQALSDFDRAIELAPNDAATYNNRGCTYEDLEQYESAIKDFDKAIQLDPKYAEAYNNRGIVYAILNGSLQAVQDFNKAIELEPNNAKAYYNRGILYGKNFGNHQRAVQDFDKAIQLNPTYTDAYYNRGFSYVMLGNFNSATADLTKVIQLVPNYAEAYMLRGICHQKLGNESKAQADFAKAKQLGYKD